MRCSKCPARSVCGDYAARPREISSNDCCFGRLDRPLQEICKECDSRELCKVSSGAGEDSVIIIEENNVMPKFPIRQDLTVLGADLPNHCIIILKEK